MSTQGVTDPVTLPVWPPIRELRRRRRGGPPSANNVLTQTHQKALLITSSLSSVSLFHSFLCYYWFLPTSYLMTPLLDPPHYSKRLHLDVVVG